MRPAPISGIDLSYLDKGQGPAVLLIHGHPFNGSMWSPQIDALQGRHRVIVPDLRGYGGWSVRRHSTNGCACGFRGREVGQTIAIRLGRLFPFPIVLLSE
jgi:pimeloyl-ACP methyl ester carboxylesterase